ncbi:unnamed protein product [Soboliphyme baturini]|uniref:PI3K/PI4K catalytic domain-containing protein n=1 Tax=Soboliphyme baturini TaxID=241478 RepID=A0A183I8X2_9BILA|nr:unnamed protein product [Soboliphyme baturini]
MQIQVPDILPLGSGFLLVHDIPSSRTLLDFLNEHCSSNNFDLDNVYNKYFEKIAQQQIRNCQPSHQSLRDVFKDIQKTYIPRNALKTQLQLWYQDPTEYFVFRKQVALHLSVLNLSEFLFHLSSVLPEQLQFSMTSGAVTSFHFRFDINESTGELDANRPVPFRLTPALTEFLGVSVLGNILPWMKLTARILQHADLYDWLQLFLWEEYFALSNYSNAEPLSNKVSKAVTAITNRLQGLANPDTGESTLSVLINAAQTLDNLCRMSPAFHPWF